MLKVFLFKTSEESKMLPKFRRIQDAKGFTLIELLIVFSIIGILAAIAVPQFSAYKNRAYQADAKANLHDIYLACKAYWSDNASTDSCTTALAADPNYGWVAKKNVAVKIKTGTESAFAATATHTSDTSSKTFTMDSNGNIT